MESRTPPLAQVREMLALARVQLAAREVPRGVLVRFYTHTLGLARVPEESGELLTFRHSRRVVTLAAEFAQGSLALGVTQFDGLVGRLQDARMVHQVIHMDGGLARMVILRDPAMNVIRLMETRWF
jgi:hypothetical protein